MPACPPPTQSDAGTGAPGYNGSLTSYWEGFHKPLGDACTASAATTGEREMERRERA